MNFAKIALGAISALVAVGSIVMAIVRYAETPTIENCARIAQPVYQHPTYGGAQPVYNSNGGNPMPVYQQNMNMFNQPQQMYNPTMNNVQPVYQQMPSFQYVQQPTYYNSYTATNPWPSCMEVLGIDPRVYPQPVSNSVPASNYNYGYDYGYGYGYQEQTYDNGSRRYSGYNVQQPMQQQQQWQPNTIGQFNQPSYVPYDQQAFDNYWNAIYAQQSNIGYNQYVNNTYYPNYDYGYQNSYNNNWNVTGEIWAPYNNGQTHDNQQYYSNYSNGMDNNIPGVRCENVHQHFYMDPNMVNMFNTPQNGDLSRYTGERNFDNLFMGEGYL